MLDYGHGKRKDVEGIRMLLELGVEAYVYLSNLQREIFNIGFSGIYKNNEAWNDIDSATSCCTSMLTLYSYVDITDPKLSSEYNRLISEINRAREDKFINLKDMNICKLILVDMSEVIDYMLLYVEISNGVRLGTDITEEDNSERVIEILRTVRVLGDVTRYLKTIEIESSVN